MLGVGDHLVALDPGDHRPRERVPEERVLAWRGIHTGGKTLIKDMFFFFVQKQNSKTPFVRNML